MKKWKKALSAFAVAAVMSVGMAATAGCGEDDVTPHEHTYKTEWTQGTNTHWHDSTCEHTGLKSDEANHADTNNDGKCDTCGYTMTVPHEHTWATVWSTSETKHWHAATCEGHTDQKKDEGDHVDTNNDGKCDTCEYVMSSAPVEANEVVINIADLFTTGATSLADGTELGEGVELIGEHDIDANGGKKPIVNGTEVNDAGYRLKLKAVNAAGERGIKLTLDDAATVLVYGISGSSGDIRTLGLYDDVPTSEATPSQTAKIGSSGNYMDTAIFEVSAAGTYYIGASNTINIYYMIVSYDGITETEASHVTARPTATCTEGATSEYYVSNYGRYYTVSGTTKTYITAQEAHAADTAALGHNYKAGTVNPIPTADTEGSATLVCENDNTHTLPVTLPVLTSDAYKERPATGATGDYVFVANGVEIKFQATGVAVAEATYTPVIDIPDFTGVTIGTAATAGQDSIYATQGTVEVADGKLKIGQASGTDDRTKAFLTLGTPITEGVVKISGKVRAEASNSNWTFFAIMNAEGKEVIAFRSASSSSWGYRVGGTGNLTTGPVSWSASKYYSYEIIIDLDQQTFSITVDGTVLADNIAYPELATNSDTASNALDSIGGIGFENINNGRYVYLDTLTVATKD